MELHYRRIGTVRRGSRVISAGVQTVVIFLPEVRSCLPTHVEWDELAAQYKHRYHMESKSTSGSEENSADTVIDTYASGSCDATNTMQASQIDDQPEQDAEDDAESSAQAMEQEASAGALDKALHIHLIHLSHSLMR